jgi:hypothetical protein
MAVTGASVTLEVVVGSKEDCRAVEERPPKGEKSCLLLGLTVLLIGLALLEALL